MCASFKMLLLFFEASKTFNVSFSDVFTAHTSMKEGKMFIGSGDVAEGNINRSPSAYLKDPSEERSQ